MVSRLRALGGKAKNVQLVQGCWELATDLMEGGRKEEEEGEDGQYFISLNFTILKQRIFLDPTLY